MTSSLLNYHCFTHLPCIRISHQYTIHTYLSFQVTSISTRTVTSTQSMWMYWNRYVILSNDIEQWFQFSKSFSYFEYESMLILTIICIFVKYNMNIHDILGNFDLFNLQNVLHRFILTVQQLYYTFEKTSSIFSVIYHKILFLLIFSHYI